MNATIDAEVFIELVANIKKIENEIGHKWKEDVEELTHHLDAAKMSTELVRIGAKQILKDKLKETREHSNELSELRSLHKVELKKLQEAVDAAKEKQKLLEEEKKAIIDSNLLIESEVKQARTVSMGV